MKGDRVRSISEAYIANFLWKRRVGYEYERPLRLGSHLLHPDFYLLEYDIGVEFWGLLNRRNVKYFESFNWKVDMYRKFSVSFIPLVQENLEYLEKDFEVKLMTTIKNKRTWTR